MREIEFLNRQHQLQMAQMRMRDLPSNEVANGDVSEDKELEDIDDPNDYVVDDDGFVNQYKRRGAVAQIRSTGNDDWNSDIGTYASQKTRNYATPYTTSGNLIPFWNENHIMDGSHGTVPRQEGDQPLRNSPDYVALSDEKGELYSNQLCNGDRDDDKELEKEDDPEDDIVDYQGHTNRGYGSALPTDFFASNHIMDGSMITTPREVGPMRNSLMQL
jgi:hypothetical protein